MKSIRRYDIDWLRVLVFGLLIFYHVGMFFVPWGWHIKNADIVKWFQYPMVFVNQWRLPILFVISGMGTAYALSFRSAGQFISERLLRLLVPLTVGILLIVPPQIYAERVYEGSFQGGYIDWLLTQGFRGGAYPEGNLSWHHLWFLPYLLVYSLLLTPAFTRLRAANLNKWQEKVQRQPYILLWVIAPLYVFEAFLEPFFPVTHDLITDWFNFTKSLYLFFIGFLLIKMGESFWLAVGRIKGRMLQVGLLTFTLLLLRWKLLEDGVIIHFVEAAISVTNLWAWILTILGFAAVTLNRSSKVLAYCNQAVYPFYILHQTITVLIGLYIYDAPWHYGLKFLIMVAGTFGISALLYELVIRRIRWLWPLFGLKDIRLKSARTTVATDSKSVSSKAAYIT